MKFKNKESKYETKHKMKKRIKNSSVFSNVVDVYGNGIIHLKTGEVARLVQASAIDLSLSSKNDRETFFYMFKSIFKIKDLCLKCYKLDEMINLNNNKINLDKLIDNITNENSINLLKEERRLIDELEEKGFTTSSIYYFVLISKNENQLKKQLNEFLELANELEMSFNLEVINNKLEIYKFLVNLYLEVNTLDQLLWSDLPSLVAPINLLEKANMLKFDDKDIQMLTLKSIPPFINELFFEELFNIPGVRACLSIKDTIDQDELIRWVNSQYQFLLSDRNTTRKLSDATELDIQKENFQRLMEDIKSGDEVIKEVSLSLVVSGDKNQREETIRIIKRLAENYQLKIEVPRLRQMELWQNYDITCNVVKDYAVYLPTLTLGSSFPFTQTYFNDSNGYMLGVDIHTSLPIYFDPFVLNNTRTSHNMAIISSTGGGKSYTMKKMIINEYARGTKLFIFDAENEYSNIVKLNGGEYIDLYSKRGGIINPLQIRYIPSDDEKVSKETDCPLAKHLGFLEAFFKTAFEDISEKELVMLLTIVEALYNKFGIYKNTSINTLESLTPQDYPIFDDLYNFLPQYKKQVTSKEKIKLIEQIDILISRFLTGTDSYLFNNHTTIDLSNKLIGFNLQELLYSGNDRIINTQVLNLLTYLNNAVVSNKIINEKKVEKNHICIVVDEFHLFIDEKNNEVLKNFGQLARRIRKYSGSLIVSTQSIKDFVGNAEVLRHATAIFNNCQYSMVGMLKEDDLIAYLELFKNNPLTDTQKNFLFSAKQGEFMLNVDNQTKLRIWIRATELERQMMGEEKTKEE